ncbi:putative nucleotide kinase [Methanocella conradii HZ254]|uniref:Putative adenylate kinase n=1 Tax=Methanocella conradii (strain DSM 24694 / JCM 17849 / CGMCC 1.5162 / HZ254) TaxID=1041930 RepID=H8IAV7_METCZ|nr:adenylate kinase family protein [Methanocella conradii]AFD00612.1 putative nucleotide kinase [Methanocella conradii HZ254]MDI6896311.1 adenylate kinase family protein [Methanocella conradii]
MKIALTGTPGTGKSTVADMANAGFIVIHLNDLIKSGYYEGIDEERGCLIADVERLSRLVEGMEGDIILEGHVSHLMPVDAIVVLRASPGALRERLRRRGWSEAKISENVEAEALDAILIEALETGKKVYEVDTTNLTPTQVRDALVEIIRGTDKYAPGSVDFSEEAFL